MKNRKPYIMLVIGIVIGLLLGVAGSSDSLFGSATDKGEGNDGGDSAASMTDSTGSSDGEEYTMTDNSGSASGSAASVAEPSEAYMIELSAVEAVLAEAYPESAGAVAASFDAAEGLGADPTNTPAVVADFEENVLPLVYEVAGGSEASEAEAEPEPIGVVICFGIKTDPATGQTTPYLYATVPVTVKPMPSLQLANFWVSNSPTSLLNFQLLACYP